MHSPRTITVGSSARTGASRACVLTAGLLALFGASCGKDDSPTAPATPTPAGLVASGWARFDRGGYAAAQGDFDAALSQDPAYGPARLGKGWCLLVTASSLAGFQSAAAHFDSAIARQQTSAAAYAGRAAARLACGGDELAGAAADAGAALILDPGFRFAHLAGFDAASVRLLLAEAEAGLGDFTAALAAIQPDYPIDLDPGSAAGWVVAGIRHESYASAVLSWLQQIDSAGAP